MADSVEVSTIETTDGTIGVIRDNAARQSIANLREGKETVGSVAWENVKGRPTKISSFENDKKYQTDENVSNTLNSTLYAGSSTHGGPATSAEKLTTARTISLSGAASGSGSFDGSANSTINVSSLDATKLTGVVPITNLPPSVIERMSVVKDDTERLALTKDTVQDGDVVKVQSSGLMYYVVDDDKLNAEAGYEVFKAGSAASVPWGGVTGKPSTYPPSSHTHTKSQITDFPSSLPNPSNLTMQVEGKNAAVYNGGTSQTFNVTKSSLGLDKVNNTADSDKSVKYAASAGNANTATGHSLGLNIPTPSVEDQDKFLSAKGVWESITGKFAQEQLTGTTGELTPTQVYEAVSAGIPVKVQHFVDTYGILSFTAFNVAESFNVIVSQTIVYFNGLYILCELDGQKSSNEWFFHSTTLYDNNNKPTPSEIGALGISDVHDWAKAENKPSYSWNEINGKPSTFVPSSHTHTKNQVGLGNVANIDQSKAIKSITRNGTTFTATALDGTTSTFTQQDTNTTYGVASQSSNGLMSAADKKAVDREFFRMLPKGGTYIPANVDLNTVQYLKVGNYYNSTNVETKTLKNCPSSNAFMMYVLSPLSEAYDNESTRAWLYRLRIFVDFTGNAIFTQQVNSGATAGSFTYGPWVKITNANDLGAVSNTINTHIANKSNPHGVTKAQVGLGNVDNTADKDKSVNYANSAGSVAKYTLAASKWSGSSAPYTYDLGSTYGANSIIGFDSAVGNTTQLEAASAANIQGSSTTKIYAYGDKPTVDIPIVINYQ